MSSTATTTTSSSRCPSPASSSSSVSFSGLPLQHKFSGLLFDMDGTLIDSTNAIIKYWHSIAAQYGLDPEVILATSHGRRSIDMFQTIDPARASWDYIRQLEGEIPLRYGNDAVEIPGSRDLLAQLKSSHAKWGIVTSGTRPLVDGWLNILRLSAPSVLVTAEDVQNGKPDPGCYRLGLRNLSLVPGGDRADNNLMPPPLCIEDAPAGVRAGKAAGCKVVALATTHDIHSLLDAGADWIIPDLRSLVLKDAVQATGEVELEIRNTLCL